ncbi:putative Exo-beta-1,3-glucanae [Xylariaceae sp. FL0662B]|nr:putative Exo-beta-1,3-glucanae [Xylariaceae sp. FL0662B]
MQFSSLALFFSLAGATFAHDTRDLDLSINASISISGSYPAAKSSECAFWLEDMQPQGIAAFNPNPDAYQVFRNVKDFGAKGDGRTDDTAAINKAISSGKRCAPGTCASSTTTLALVYFPSGTYLVTNSIVNYYYTMIVGNPNCMPVIKASSNFTARFVIDGNKYGDSGSLGWGATNVFWSQIRNFVVDTTNVAPSVLVSGIHWTVSQATSIQNIVFKLSQKPGTQHEGIFIQEGSGGFVSDLTFEGGNYGLNVGNQQYTMRNLSIHNAATAINQLWSWGWTYKSVSINNCTVGLNMSSLDDETGAQEVGSVVLIDSEINDTPVGFIMARSSNSTPKAGGSLVLENVALNNVPLAIEGPGNTTVLAGSSGELHIDGWGQGHRYDSHARRNFQAHISPSSRPLQLMTGTGYYERSKPHYGDVPSSQFVSVRTAGARGDGKTDDTQIINAVLRTAAATNKIVFFDAGYYRVTSTIYVPAGSKIVGEAFPVIMSSGPFFANMDLPLPVVQVGVAGEIGTVEWSDMIVSSQGAQAGAILIEYNLASPAGEPTGLWDVHTRVGGFAGSELTVAECPKTPNTTATPENINEECIAAFMSMHVNKWASGLYMENCWLWVADHDVDDANLTQITIYAGRGLLIESDAGGLWLYGTGVEHHSLYEYQLVGTKDVAMGQIQTETAYYQPNPDATIPFAPVPWLNDPVLERGANGWGLRVVDSSDVFVYGAGLYSFFNNYNVSCSQENSTVDCQPQIFSVEDSEVSVFNLNTVGTTKMITVDGKDVANAVDHPDGFVDTVAVFKS